MTRAREQLAVVADGWNRFWFGPVSTAPLAVFRIVFGVIVFFWTLSLLPELTPLFTKGGVFPHQAHLPTGGWGLFGTFPSKTVVLIVWAVLLVASIALTLGVFAQLAALLVFIAVVSFEQRNPWVFNSGDGLIRIIAFYLIFVPSSASLSLTRFLRHRGEFWSFPTRAAWPMRLLQIQFSAVYLFAVWDKARGTMWNNGTAVSVALRITDLQRFPVPGFISHSLLLSNLLSFGTLVIELSLAVLIWNRRLRPFVLLAGLSLHLGIEYAIRVGFFGFSILSMYLLWVPSERVEAVLLALRRRLSRTPAAVPVTAASPGS
ncbi:MAG TPA: HTTM domain-containing protein [Gaiellaceae bacterium]|nr:HTTM domain-containing protein [Gaiellaceae bacterium]